MENKDIDIKILPNGSVQMVRFSDEEKNQAMNTILSEMVCQKDIKNVDNFYKEAEHIDLIFGNRIMCG